MSDSESSSIMSEVTQYTLALNPEDWEDEWEHEVYDGGVVDGDGPNSCPHCKKIFKGQKKNYGTWIGRHIRLHDVQAKRVAIFNEEELVNNAVELARKTLSKLCEEESSSAVWLAVKATAAAISSEDNVVCAPFFKLTVARMAAVVCHSQPVFLRDERKVVLKHFHRLTTDIAFRQECFQLLTDMNSEISHPNMFLSSYLSILRDVCGLFRLSKMREKLTPPTVERNEDRDEVVMYVGGWVLRCIRRNCWKRGNMKHSVHAQRYECLMAYFVEGGQNAEPVEDQKKRKWIDKKNRGELVNGVRKNGLMVPSQQAFLFFGHLDRIFQSYESRTGLREPLTFESVMAKVYDNILILDCWQALTSSLPHEDHQLSLLEFVVRYYRRFLGHAVADRVVRGMKSRQKVATRTNLKKN